MDCFSSNRFLVECLTSAVESQDLRMGGRAGNKPKETVQANPSVVQDHFRNCKSFPYHAGFGR